MTTAPPLTLFGSLRWDVVRREFPPAPRRVLEVGCGQGAVGVRLAAAGHDYTGVELDGASADVAAARLTDAGLPGRVVHGSVDELDRSAAGPGPTDRGYDVVCAFEVLEHLEDDAGALASWVELLRPGGLVLVSTPAWRARYGPMDAAVGHHRRYEPAQMRALLAGAGLADVGGRLYGAPLGYALEAVRNQVARRRLDDRTTTAERTARSGRLFQPSSALQGVATAAATWPFRVVQRALPQRGPALVAWGTRPAA
ncbi:methyltransferase family protein [Isoptericola sp. CG 20/1183]|uniref:Methyltransferase family protein n=1 Tax=Isoptericola halotolerans TaxID=300560 RepID=A0ABX5EFA5_9MICO|nr:MULTISPECIES: methyltransferase domain-containing protein [Isoptericola]PRZ08089.1 methyltransferase family protein [Isoptericola halotolerans]PRZ08887.1 methyltransferase family protein [Isoptericola sp. CG 20/1183]